MKNARVSKAKSVTAVLVILGLLPLAAGFASGAAIYQTVEPLAIAQRLAVGFRAEQADLEHLLIEIDQVVSANDPAALKARQMATRYGAQGFAKQLATWDQFDYQLLDSAIQSQVSAKLKILRDTLASLDLLESTYLSASRATTSRHESLQGALTRATEALRSYRYQPPSSTQRRATFGQLSELSFLLNNIAVTTNDSLVASDSAVLNALRTDFEANLRTAIFQLSVLPDGELRQSLANELALMFEQGLGPSSLYMTLQGDIKLLAQIERARLTAKTTSVEIKTLLNMLDAQSADLAASTLGDVSAHQTRSIALVAVVSIIAWLLSAWLGWRVVYPLATPKPGILPSAPSLRKLPTQEPRAVA